MHSYRSLSKGLVGLALLSSPVLAQFNDSWVGFTDQTTTRLPGGAFSVSDLNHEVRFAWGDLNQDGFVDLVVARKQPFTTAGQRTNLLLMNEAGVLVDRTAQWASAADVLGDQGFLTPTNDRDIEVIDIDNDGWLDVVTSATTSDGFSKAIGHPRIYRNLGQDGGGNWLGMRFENARIPQLFSYDTGLPENPRFSAVAAGDVNGDGFADLYFGDHDSSTAGGVNQPAGKDLNDRLLINDGNGFFTDESQLRLSATALNSGFCSGVAIGDYNLDGHNDVMKSSSGTPPIQLSVAFNNPSSVGAFSLFKTYPVGSPYNANHGDLNNDGRLDLLVTDDLKDRVHINTGNTAFGDVAWTAPVFYQFLAGEDDGFGGDILVADLDGDGWNDTLHADVDLDVAGYQRRLHIYHNRTTVVGTSNVVLREERENSSSTGWVGAVGLTENALRGTHHMAALDLDNDGDLDLVLGRKDGTQVYINEPVGAPACGFFAYGTGLGGANTLTLTGSGSMSLGSTVSLTTTGINGSVAYHVISLAQTQAPLLGGTLLVDLNQQFAPLAAVAASAGQSVWNLNLPTAPGSVGQSGYVQVAAPDATMPAGFALSNGLELKICP